MRIVHDFDLSVVTTFHIKATARIYAEYDSISELRQLLFAPEYSGMEKLHIGAGSNLLFTSTFDGMIIHSAIRKITMTAGDGDDDVFVKASGGVVWDDFVSYCVDHGLYGAENLSYIPGEAGASAVQNVGAYGVEAKDIIHTVEAIDTTTGDDIVLGCDDCGYGYRDSIFKHNQGRYIVTSVTYRLSRTPHFTLDYGPLRELAGEKGLTLQDVRSRIIDIRRSKLPEPDKFGSAGSFFKNPVITQERFGHLKADYPDLPSYPAPGGMVKVPAAWLIEQCGMKGRTNGGARVYDRQCLVIVNIGNATSADVVALFGEIREKVAAKFGISLSPEVNIIGKL